VNHYNGVDVIEIKTHLTPALVWDNEHKNFSFSPALSKAIIQTMNYMDAVKEGRFASEEERSKITGFTDKENLYRPRGIIIISSANRLVKNQARMATHKDEMIRDFTKLRSSLHNIEILTFDEILDSADHYIKSIVKKAKKSSKA
jgi:hypothetical protein